jgi:cobalt-zinc-cadmium efflux system outer membrane protein
MDASPTRSVLAGALVLTLAAVALPLAAQQDGPRDDLGEELQLSTVLRVVLAKNPELAEASARANAATALVGSAGRLPPLQFEYQLWAAPLARPYALDEAEMHMFGVKQTFPAFGSLEGESRAASEQAKAAAADRQTRELDIVARVRRAYAEYYRTDREYRIHLDHVRLAQQTLDMARAAYQGGRGTQQDVLRTVVELSRLHNDLAGVDNQRRAARGLLNTLMARPLDAPLAPPAAIDPVHVLARADGLVNLKAENRPELAAASSAIRARQQSLDAARSSASYPELMVGLQYMYMPMSSEPHAYGAMLGVSLPWLTSRYDDQVRAAEAALATEQSARSSIQNAADYELFEATGRMNASRESLTIIERDLLPQAQQSFDAAQAMYRSGQGDSMAMLDALRTWLQIRIERERALALLEMAIADVERAAGSSLHEALADAGKAR